MQQRRSMQQQPPLLVTGRGAARPLTRLDQPCKQRRGLLRPGWVGGLGLELGSGLGLGLGLGLGVRRQWPTGQ